MSPPYLPICSIYLSFQVNLYVPNSKPSNEIPFCMLEKLMYQLGLSVSSMLGGLFSKEWTLLLTHENMAGHRDAQSHALRKSNQNNCKQNSPRAVVSWTVPRCSDGRGVCLLVVGEYKLYHSISEPPIICVAWKISPSLGCYVDNESMPLKILFISISKSSSGTSTKGLSIYFYVESSPSY